MVEYSLAKAGVEGSSPFFRLQNCVLWSFGYLNMILLDTFKYVWFDFVREFLFILSDLCQRDLVREPIDRREDDHNLSFDRDQGIL